MPIHSLHQYLHIYKSYLSLVLFMTSLSVFIPPLWQHVLIFISILLIFKSTTWINPRLLRPFPPRNMQQDVYNTIFYIGWSAAVTAGLDTLHPNCIEIYLHLLNVQQLGAGVGGVYVLEPAFVGWTSLWVDAIRTLLRTIFVTTRTLPC